MKTSLAVLALNDHVLKLMRKGVSALQNVQLLKWCRQYDVTVRRGQDQLVTGLELSSIGVRFGNDDAVPGTEPVESICCNLIDKRNAPALRAGTDGPDGYLPIGGRH